MAAAFLAVEEVGAFLAGAFLAVVVLAVVVLAAVVLAGVDLLVVLLAAVVSVGVDLLGVDLLAVDLLAVDLLAVDLLTVDLLGVDLLAVDLLGVDLLAVDLLAVDLLAVDLLAVDLLGVLFAVGDVAGAFVAGALVVADAVEAFFAGDFLAGVVDVVSTGGVAVDVFLAVAPLTAPAARAAVFLAAAVDLVAAAAAVLGVGSAGIEGKVSFGSFLAPETKPLRSAPAVNFGTEVFLVFICSPVRGLRTVRAGRARFSNEPKPVMATFSPRATSRVMVSITESRAWAASLRFPSKRAASASMSCVLFTFYLSAGLR